MTKVLINCVKDEIKRNESIIAKLMGNAAKYHRGSVERTSRGKYKYFRLTFTEDGKRVRMYLGAANSEKFREYLAGLCAVKRIAILKYNNKILKRLLEVLRSDSIEAINARLPEACKGLVTEGFVDERMEELKAWAAEDYPRNPSEFYEKKCFACDGTRVRSKGEIIIYNMLVELGIPFRYDSGIEVEDDWENLILKYPDFLIQCYDGTFIIIEHLGGLKKASYCSDFAMRCRYYLKEGYVLGENFFVTSDDAHGGVDSEAIAEIIAIVERRFYRAA